MHWNYILNVGPVFAQNKHQTFSVQKLIWFGAKNVGEIDLGMYEMVSLCLYLFVLILIVFVFVSGLFRRVILMSGSLFASWARVRDPLNYALQLGKYFNCTIPNDLTNDHNQVCQ